MKSELYYRVTYSCPEAGTVDRTYHSAGNMASGITYMEANGYKVEDIEQFRPSEDPDNVRFDYETGERIQYADAADASEHHLRMMGG